MRTDSKPPLCSHGAANRRYNGDGYGEHADGRPFDGLGIGRAWPLLVAERGHLALQSGEDPLPSLQTMWRCASAGRLLPEQVSDADPIPALELVPGRPSGGAMPLVWAHAEFLKLLVARERGRPVEWLASVEHHFGHRPLAHEGTPVSRQASAVSRGATIWHWRDEVPIARLPAGKSLAIEDRIPFTLHLGFDGWQQVVDRHAEPGSFGIWSVVLSEQELAAGELNFTRRYESGWENCDHRVALERREPHAVELPRQASATDESSIIEAAELAVAEG